jgi:hypothetical protein
VKPEIKERWIEALESGKYRQTQGHLQVKDGADSEYRDGYCCLGVLCELAVEDGVVNVKTNRNVYGITEVEYFSGDPDESVDSSTTELPEAVVEWAGLSEINPNVSLPITGWPQLASSEDFGPEDTATISLAELNDEYEFNFHDIARVVRELL